MSEKHFILFLCFAIYVNINLRRKYEEKSYTVPLHYFSKKNF